MDDDAPEDRILFIEPVCEDWHVLMCFLKVKDNTVINYIGHVGIITGYVEEASQTRLQGSWHIWVFLLYAGKVTQGPRSQKRNECAH